MTCYRFDVPGGGIAIACSRAPRQRCHVCGENSNCLCDGCDKPVCVGCSVRAKPETDFCPTCARPAFVAWLAHEAWARALEREARRAHFRSWASRHAEPFLTLVSMSAAAKRALGPVP